MKTFTAPVLAAFAGQGVVLAQLLALEFSTTPVYLNTSNWDLVWGGNTYKGAYGLGQISVVADKPGEVQGLQLELAAGSPAIISLALDDADIVQGTVCTLRTAVFDPATYQILDAPVDWAGKLDTMAIMEQGDTASVAVTAESRAVDLLRGNASYYADADQVAINPADRSFQYVVDQIDKPIVWPSRQFYYK